MVRQVYPRPGELNGSEALARFLEYDWDMCVDVGSGAGEHARVMRKAGRSVFTIDNKKPADLQNDYPFFWPMLHLKRQYVPAIWCSHCLEHQEDTTLFLEKLYLDLAPGGVLALTVPPLKHAIVGGHVTLWNAGLLLYRMILAGFDCSEARVGTYGYNISVIVKRKPRPDVELYYATGDIEALAPFFPCPVQNGFDGRLPNINW